MSDCGKIAIIGGGSWATAIAKIVLEKAGHLNWYIRRQGNIDAFIRLGYNPSYLTSVKFDTGKITFSNDINEIVEQSDTVIFVTPSPYLKQVLKKLHVKLNDKFVVTAIKGIIPEEELVVTEYFRQIDNAPDDSTGVIFACIPGDGELDLKALAKASGNKRAEPCRGSSAQPSYLSYNRLSGPRQGRGIGRCAFEQLHKDFGKRRRCGHRIRHSFEECVRHSGRHLQRFELWR